MELEDVQAVGRKAERVVVHLDEVVRRAGRRQRRAVEVGRQLTAERRAFDELDQPGRRIARQHLVALERNRRGAEEVVVRVEQVRRHVVGVRPDAEVRVVVEDAVAEEERVAEVRARRVGGLRYRDALVVRRGRCELREEPPVGELVVLDDRVAVIPGLARAAEAGPERVDLDGTEELRACLAVDGDRRVDHLDVVVRTYVPVRVGRQGEADDVRVEALPVEAHARCRQRLLCGRAVRAGAPSLEYRIEHVPGVVRATKHTRERPCREEASCVTTSANCLRTKARQRRRQIALDRAPDNAKGGDTAVRFRGALLGRCGRRRLRAAERQQEDRCGAREEQDPGKRTEAHLCAPSAGGCQLATTSSGRRKNLIHHEQGCQVWAKLARQESKTCVNLPLSGASSRCRRSARPHTRRACGNGSFP